MALSEPHIKKDFSSTLIFISLLTVIFLMFSMSTVQAAGKAYVTDIYGTTVSVVDLSANSVIKTIPDFIN